MTKRYTIKLSDLAQSTITCQKPLKSDGTVSLTIEDDHIIVTFNTDFVETYEKQLYAQAVE